VPVIIGFFAEKPKKTEQNLRFGTDLEPIQTSLAYAHPVIID
jgi:hypothetical protein